jgi:hypothetical protein
MRRVKVSKWERRQVKTDGGVVLKSYLEAEPDGEAWFHQWGVGCEEYGDGAGNFTTAVVERDDGSIENVEASMIKFIKPYKGE